MGREVQAAGRLSDVPLLQTRRLRLRPLVHGDLEAQLAMDLDPEVARFISGAPPDPVEQRAKLLAQIEGRWPQRGGIWCVEWRERPGFIGWCGLFPLDGSPDEIEIGYRYVRGAWGSGVATEAGRVVRDFGFEVMGLDDQLAVTHPDNAASQRVLAKLGFEPRGTGFHYGRELPRFGLTRNAWPRQRDR